uniref:CSON010758 protein n=1 Tax=Culicoides sonorensis TaxID=179676 RepID=A0A336M241_CULSO
MESGIIKKLDESVVNKIAAGEVTIRGGGIQFLQIQDNGTGIRKEDLPILCERFTTSKLKTFEDLTSISTYGFRGEALSSISQVSFLSVTTKTRDQQCAYKVSYDLGKMKDSPKACAGNQGTTITIENLFYNLPSRLKSITKDKSTESKLLSDVVTKYAVHNSKIAFSLKINENKNCIKTQINSTKIDVIRTLYGNEIARELLEFSFEDKNLNFNCTGLISKPNYSIKKMIMLLFINNRLVKSGPIKKMVDELYGIYLEKGGKPFVYLSLDIEPQNVDVNIHPTKNEVCFLHEETIITKIRTKLDELLKGKSVTKTYLSQSILPGASNPNNTTNDSRLLNKTTGTNVDKSFYPKQVVRTDANLQNLHKFFSPSSTQNLKTNRRESTSVHVDDNMGLNISNKTKNQVIELHQSLVQTKPRKVIELQSVKSLKEEIENACSLQWKKIFEQLVFVGHVDRERALIQHNTELYFEELFSQQIIYNLENFGTLNLDPPLDLRELILLALNEHNISETQPSTTVDLKTQAELIQVTLCTKSQILEKFFNIIVTASGELLSLPRIVEGHTPNFAYLPNFILNLALCVDWDNEKQCFDTFSKVAGKFYSKISYNTDAKQWKWIVEHILYSNLKNYLLPNKILVNSGAIIKLTSTQELYKVFERC